MKSRWIVKMLALLAALALCVPTMLAEEPAQELGEIDLYDPAIYIGDGQSAPTDQSAEAPASDEAPTPEPAAEADPEPSVVPGPASPRGKRCPEPSAEPESNVDPVATVAPELTDVPEATVDPEPTIEPEATVEPDPAVDPEATLEPLLADDGAEVAPADVAADLRMGLGEQFPLDGAALLGGAAATGYASDHPEIVSVDPATGVLTANALGVAVIAVSGAGASANYTVQVLNAPAHLVFPPATLELGKGESAPLPGNRAGEHGRGGDRLRQQQAEGRRRGRRGQPRRQAHGHRGHHGQGLQRRVGQLHRAGAGRPRRS